MSSEAEKMGIVVTSPQYMRHVLGVAKAAKRAGKKVMVFFTFKSVHLTKHPDFACLANLCELEDIAICADSYTCEGYDVEKDVPKGLVPRQMRTQAYLGAILDECNKVLFL